LFAIYSSLLGGAVGPSLTRLALLHLLVR
jgi:hypothetical protein